MRWPAPDNDRLRSSAWFLIGFLVGLCVEHLRH
jgi:hypothetical protein